MSYIIGMLGRLEAATTTNSEAWIEENIKVWLSW
jgi:hypothetical protein